MAEKTALVFHMNLDHANLARAQAIQLINEGLNELYGAVKSPINVSSTARDWQLLQVANPDLLKRIIDNEHIKVLNGTYSHAILNHFPGLSRMQASMGAYHHEAIFGEDLSPFGLVPEFGLDSGNISDLVENWEGNIVNGSTTLSMDTDYDSQTTQGTTRRDLRYAGSVNILAPNGGIRIPAIVSDREPVSETINRFFRGSNDIEHLTARFQLGRDRTQGPIATYVQDFETPIINRASYEGKLIPRTDKWIEFMTALEKEKENYTFLDYDALELTSDFAEAQGIETIVIPRNTDKWIDASQARDLSSKLRVLEDSAQSSEPYFQNALMQAMTSDTFVVLSQIGQKILPTPGRVYDEKKRKFVMVENYFSNLDPLRYLETLHLIRAVQDTKRVNEDTAAYPEEVRVYFDLLDKVFDLG